MGSKIKYLLGYLSIAIIVLSVTTACADISMRIIPKHHYIQISNIGDELVNAVRIEYGDYHYEKMYPLKKKLGGPSRGVFHVPDEVVLEWSLKPGEILRSVIDIRHQDHFQHISFLIDNREVSTCFIPSGELECICRPGHKLSCPIEGPFKSVPIDMKDNKFKYELDKSEIRQRKKDG